MTLPVIPGWFRYAAVIVAGLALMEGYRYVQHQGNVAGRAAVQALWDADKIERTSAQLNALVEREEENNRVVAAVHAAYSELIKGKDNDMAKERLAAAATERLRLGTAWCDGGRPAAAGEATSAGSGNRADPASRVLSESLDRSVKSLILETEEVAATGRACQAALKANGLMP